MSKIYCPNKYELCQDCRRTFVPVNYPLVNGKRLCTDCTVSDLSICSMGTAAAIKSAQILALRQEAV